MRLLLTSLLFLQSCSEVGLTSGTEKPDDQKENPAQVQEPQTAQKASQPIQTPVVGGTVSGFLPTPVVEYEGVTSPTRINGVLLHCGLAMAARDGLTNSMVTCRFEDASGSRVPASSVAYRHEFTVSPLTYATTVISERANSDYDAWIEIRAATTADANLATSEAIISVDFFDETDVKVGNLSAKASDKDLPLQLSKWNHSQVNTSTIYHQERAGLSWDLGANSSSTQGVSASKCADSTYGDLLNWRLPTLDELRVAEADGLENARGFAFPFTEYWTSTSADDPGTAYSVVIKSGPTKGKISLTPKSTSLGIFCVHD